MGQGQAGGLSSSRQQAATAEPPSTGDIASFNFLEDSSKEIDRASARNDFRTVDRLMDAQLSEVMQGLLLEDYQSGQTGSVMSRRMMGAKAEANLAAVALQITRRNAEMDGVLEAGGWGQIQAFSSDVIRRYKERNGADLVTPKPGMTEEELVQASMQFQPVMVDPNEVANYRQQLAKLDAQLRPLGTSVWTDPKTARIASIIQNSAEPGRPGYLADDEQNLNDQLDPFTKYVGAPVVEGAEAVIQPFVDLGVGARDVLQKMGVVAVDGLTQGQSQAFYQGPTSWVQDQDGTWYHNGGKITGVDLAVGIWQSMTGDMVDQAWAQIADTKAKAAMQASGVQWVAQNVAVAAGSIIGFMGAAGPAMQAGGNLTKGLGILATGGKAAKSLSRTEAMVKIMAEKSGTAAALGLEEALKGGRIEGYGNAMLHGTIMAVPMMVMGSLGDKLERTLMRYKSMPKPMARGLAGTVEGLGLDLDTWEAGWQFVQDPSNKTFSELTQRVLVNSLTNGFLRGTGVTANHAAETPPVAATKQEARRVEATTKEPQEVAAMRSVTPESVEQLGRAETIRKGAVGNDPEVAMASTKDVKQAEQKLNVEEAGLAMTESEKIEARYATKEELDRLKREPNTPEKRKKIIDLLNSSRLAFGKDFTGFAQKVIDQNIANKRDADELLGASDTVKALLGDRAASDYRKERGAKLKEQGIEMTDLAVEEGKGVGGKPKSEDAEMEAMAKKLGMTVDELRKEMGEDAPESPKITDEEAAIAREAEVQKFRKQYERLRGDLKETVPGKEPAPIREIQDKPLPDRMMIQEGGKEGLVPDQLKPPKGPPAPRPVTPEQALTERLDPETGKPMVLEARAPSPAMPGEPASLRLRPDLETAGVPGTKKIRASDVMRDLDGYEGDIVQTVSRKGVGIRGRTSTRGILGWYDSRQDLIRMRDSRNVAVKTHEFSHAMDVKLDGSRGLLGKRSPLTQAEKDGFVRAAFPYYPGYEKLPRRAQEMESWAEFWARHMLGDPELRQETGAFHDWAMKWMADPARAKFLPEFQRRINALSQYRDQGSVLRGEAAIGFFDDPKSIQELKSEGIMSDTAPAKAAGAVRRLWKAVRKVVFDDLADLKRSQETSLVRAMGKDKADEIRLEGSIVTDPARLMETWRMTGTRQAERFLVTGTHDVAGNPTGESLKKIFDDVGGKGTYRDFMNWLAAKRRIEARNKGLEMGPTSLLDDQVIVDKLGNQAFENGAKRIRAYSDRLLDYGVEAGLFSAEQAKNIRESYEFFIPFQRILEGPTMAGPGRGVAERGTGVKSMKGSTEEIKDPLTSLANMTRAIITKSQQAMVVKAAVMHGIVHNGVGGFITEVPRKNIPKDHPMVQIADAIRATAENSQKDVQMGVEEAAGFLEKMAAAGEIGASVTLWGQSSIPKGSRAIIAYTPHFTPLDLGLMNKQQQAHAERINGKLMWLELDVPAYESLMGLDVPANLMDKLPPVLAGLATGAAYLDRLGATVLNPVFLALNPIRDMATWALTTRQKTLPGPASLFSAMGAYASGIRAVLKQTKSAEKMENLGAGVGTYFGQEFSRGRSAQELLGVHRGLISSVRAAVGKLGDMFSKGELALRQREFKDTYDKEIAKGRSDLEASIAALEAAQHIVGLFTRGGTLTRAMNSIVPYTMAKTTTAIRITEVLSGRKGPELQRQAITRALTTITIPSIALWWLNRDEDWYQELPEHERLGYWHIKLPGTDEPIKIPKPFEWGKFFGNVPEVLLEQAFDQDPRSVIDVAWDATSSLLPSNIAPSIVQPFMEQKSNFDFFRERPIVPEWLSKNRLPKDQFTAYTRWYAKAAAKALGFAGLDVSPIRIERGLDSATGGLIGRGNDLFTDLWALRKIVNDEDFTMGDTPVLGRAFVNKNPFSQSRSVQKIFDLDEVLNQRAGSKALLPHDKRDRREIDHAKEKITALKAAARSGVIPRLEADRRAAEIARETLKRIDR